MSRQRSVGIIYNPISGRGRAARRASLIETTIADRGYQATLRRSEASYDDLSAWQSFLEGLDFVLVSGGDGTLRALLEPLASAGKPVYLLPEGNESLCSRHFSMSDRPEAVLNALERGAVTEHYFGLVNGRAFFTMVSLGLDSQVVEHIAYRRKGPLGHRGYLLPFLHCMRNHRPPVITLSVDGRTVLENKVGYLIVANTAQYACHLQLVSEADSRSSALHARFVPYSNVLDYLLALLKSAFRPAAFAESSLLFEGQRLEIVTTEPYPLQADGDFAESTPGTVEISASRLKVLQAR